jgi:hypothetical protein
MKWLYTFAVVTQPWFEQAEASLCRPRGGLLTARARCFEDHVRLLLDYEGSASLLFLRLVMDERGRTHSRVAGLGAEWVDATSPAQQAAWERFARDDLLIESSARPVFLPVPVALERRLATQLAPASDDAFNRALRDGLQFLQSSGGVLLVTGRQISTSIGEATA